VNDNKNENWLDSRARQTMVENGFEPNFSPDARAEVDAIQKGYSAPTAVDGLADLRDLQIGRASCRERV